MTSIVPKVRLHRSLFAELRRSAFASMSRARRAIELYLAAQREEAMLRSLDPRLLEDIGFEPAVITEFEPDHASRGDFAPLWEPFGCCWHRTDHGIEPSRPVRRADKDPAIAHTVPPRCDAALSPDEMARFRPRSMRAGESIAAYGFPLAGTLSASGNIVSGNVSSLAGLADDVRLLQISAPIQPGNSGGPLMDYTGAVVGIVNGKLNDLAAAEAIGSLPQNVNFSIKANVGMNFLDAHSIPYELSNETTLLDLPTIADKAKKFTVFIKCKYP
jgi:hypothetical protein